MKFNRILAVAVCACLLAVCLLCGGCSTPAVALEVSGKTYTMGDYLAYVYYTLNTDSTAATYLSYMQDGAFEQEVTYGATEEENSGTQVKFDEYVRLTAQDTMLRQKALEDLLKKYNIAIDAEEQKTVDGNLASMTADMFLDLGFNNQRYSDMYKAVSLNEMSLFTGLYDKGGQRAVSADDERAFFEKNFYSYYLFEISLVDDQGADFTADATAAVQTKMDTYLATFEKNGKTVEALNGVYATYLEDKAKDESGSEKEENADTKTTLDRQDVVATDKTVDADLIKAIGEIEEGSAAVKTYLKNGTTKTMALIYRMDPEVGRGEDVNYYTDSHDSILQHMKYDEFNEEVEKTMEELKKTAVFHKKALNAANIKDMYTRMVAAG